jgi:glycosyltransferase involved in cell wall biosynthesis
MRIVIDARESGTSTGRYVDKLVEYLHHLKPQHEIIVLTKSKRLNFLKLLAPDFKIVASDHKEFTFGEQLGLWRQLRKLKPDLVHFAMVQQPVLYRGKVITTMHDLTTTRFRNPAKNRLVFSLKQAVYKWLNRYVARKSRHIITISRFVKNDVAQYCRISPNKISVTYLAADKINDRPQPVDSLEGKHFLLYVGRPLPHKNLTRLVDAFSMVRQKQPSLLLAIAGSLDKNSQMLKEHITDRAIGGVVFTGHISEGQLRWLYQHARAYVFPSLSEGFGLPGLEAMLYGLPVAASKATSLPEVYKDAAIYFDPLNLQDISQKITELLDDPQLRLKLRQRGIEVAAAYSWRRMAEQTLDVYNKFLS